MKRLVILCAAMICTAAAGVLAQDSGEISSVQRKLKDAGFYYGEVTGRSDADTTAAIRRYQIRNGLKVTGTLNAETRKSLGLRAGSSTPPPRATPAPTPRPTPVPQIAPAEEDLSDLQDDSPLAPVDPRGPIEPEFEDDYGRLFEGTPYDMAPPEVQQRVIVGAQVVLARQGLYRSGVDGIFGPGTEFALRAFQTRAGLDVTGRFDMETLDALGLLPRRQRVFRRPPPPEERIYIPRPRY